MKKIIYVMLKRYLHDLHFSESIHLWVFEIPLMIYVVFKEYLYDLVNWVREKIIYIEAVNSKQFLCFQFLSSHGKKKKIALLIYLVNFTRIWSLLFQNWSFCIQPLISLFKCKTHIEIRILDLILILIIFIWKHNYCSIKPRKIGGL